MYPIYGLLLFSAMVINFVGCGLGDDFDQLFGLERAKSRSTISPVSFENSRDIVETSPVNSRQDGPTSSSSTPVVVPAFVESALAANGSEMSGVTSSFVREITQCGIQAKKTNCLVSAFNVIDTTTVDLSDGKITFSLLGYGNTDSRLGLIVESDKQAPLEHIKWAKVVVVEPKINRVDLIKNDYIFNRGTALLKVNLANDSQAYAATILGQNNLDYRQYFYAIEYLIDHSPSYRSAATQGVRKYFELIASASDDESPKYKLVFLNTIRLALSDDPDLVRMVAYRFVIHNEGMLQQFAATILVQLGEESRTLHNLVFTAVKNQQGFLLPLAIEALSLIRSGPADENLILSHLADGDMAIENLIVKISAHWNLSEEHIPVLEKLPIEQNYRLKKIVLSFLRRISSHKTLPLLARLFRDYNDEIYRGSLSALRAIKLSSEDLPVLSELIDPNISWLRRQEMVEIIARIPGSDAAHILISCVNDSHGDVRSAAVAALKKYTLNNNALPFLHPLITSVNWLIRREGVLLASRIGTSEAVAAILPLVGDNNYDVRDALSSVMSLYRLSNNEIPLLKIGLASVQWTSRKQAVQLLATIGTIEAADAILPALGDNNFDVRNAAFEALKSLPCDDTLVPSLANVAESMIYGARLSTAYVLARIKTERATTVLLTLVFDSNYDVRKAAVAAINNHPFSTQNIDSLEQSLDSQYSFVREAAAQMIGLTGACRTLSWLESRRAREFNYDVKNAINAAITRLSTCH